MANPNPPVGARWKKGQSGNPEGRRKLPADLRNIAEVTTAELKRIISKHFRMILPEIQKVIDNPQSTALDLIIASTIKQAIKRGDIQKAEYLFNRCMGRVTGKVEITQPEPVVIKRLNGEEICLDVQAIEGSND